MTRTRKKGVVTVKTIAAKLQEGFTAEGWTIVGLGGSRLAALKPLLKYLSKHGLIVHDSNGFSMKGSKSVQL